MHPLFTVHAYDEVECPQQVSGSCAAQAAAFTAPEWSGSWTTGSASVLQASRQRHSDALAGRTPSAAQPPLARQCPP
jgi:hypothetical protein